jgi:murein L,D-transpeptidase YcbB/YkuD
VLALLSLLGACQAERKPDPQKMVERHESNTFSEDEFASLLSASIATIDTTDSSWIATRLITAEQGLSFAYQSGGFKPLWIKGDKSCAAADALLQDLDSLRCDGLDTARYGLAALKALRQKATAKEYSLADIILFDTLCTHMYLKASHDLLFGAYTAKKVDTLWFHRNDSSWNAHELLAAMSADHQYPKLAAFRSKWPQYELLRNAYFHYAALAGDAAFLDLKRSVKMSGTDSLAMELISRQMPWLTIDNNDSVSSSQQLVRGFQYYFGQKVTGKIDSPTYARLTMAPDSVLDIIGVNMERMRWMNQVPEHNYVIVDIPLMELYLWRDDQPVMHMRTVVGKFSRQTPSLSAAMTNVVINPPWGVPPTILKKEIGPGLDKQGSVYLAKKGLHAYDAKGNKVDASRITGANFRKFNYRQPPGERNALGVIKFNLPNPLDIYLHDTPHKEDFPNRNRSKSSGCVRVEKPREMAEYILAEMESMKKFSRGNIDSIVLTRKSLYQPLKNKIQVHIVYLTAFQDSSGRQMRLLDDIYKHDIAMSAKSKVQAAKQAL